jgi:hypothetical protein
MKDSRRRRQLAAALIVAGVVWLLVNKPVEGPVLISFTVRHGLSAADLLSIAAFVVAGWLLLHS